MKYQNAADILPQELVEAIQQYTQGTYLYIPVNDRQTKALSTPYHTEIEKRDRRIYTMHLEGLSGRSLATMFHLSPSSIRRIISAHRKRCLPMEQRIHFILPNWGLSALSVHQIYDTVWKVGNEIVLKVYEDSAMMQRNIHMITGLVDKQIPAGKIIETIEGTQFSRDDRFFYVMFEKLNGTNLSDLQKDTKLPYKMGQTLAKLHAALREYEKDALCWDNSLLEEINGWVKNTFQKHDWPYIPEADFSFTASMLETVYPALPVQLIHRDVHLGNFLFDNGEFSGYVDFDLSQRNIRMFDLCYFLTGLLSEQEKRKITSETWFLAVKDLFDGYQSNEPISKQERKAVPYIMCAIELLFAAWFTEQNDVQCAQNASDIYHFVKSNTDRILHILS